MVRELLRKPIDYLQKYSYNVCREAVGQKGVVMIERAENPRSDGQQAFCIFQIFDRS